MKPTIYLKFKNYTRSILSSLGLLYYFKAIISYMRRDHSFKDSLCFYEQFVKAGDLVFDVGANRGQSSQIFTNIGAKVVAYEPQTTLHPQIRQLSKNSKNLIIRPEGMGAKSEKLYFHLSTFDEVASLRSDWEGDQRGKVEIDVTTLDQEIEKYGVPDFCKIDVEGWEAEVLQGLTQPIPIISFEYHLRGNEPQKAIDALRIIANLGDFHCNIREAHSPSFHSENHLSLKEFMDGFPDKLTPKLKSKYGEIFCFLRTT